MTHTPEQIKQLIKERDGARIAARHVNGYKTRAEKAEAALRTARALLDRVPHDPPIAGQPCLKDCLACEWARIKGE